jgi:phosphoribosylanthranilate isomerase
MVARTSVNENVDASIYGLEGELVWSPVDDFIIDGNVSYLKTEINDFSSIDPRDPSNGNPNWTVLKDISDGSNCVLASAQLATARAVRAAGATALGVVFAPASPRCVSPDRARDIVEAVPAHVPVVGVFVNAPLEEIVAVVAHSGIRIVQLHGDEPVSYAAALKMPLWRAAGVDVSPGAWPTATLLLDAVSSPERGGTGTRVDWDRAAAIARQRKTVLAGGLTPDNVAAAIGAVRPFGVVRW